METRKEFGENYLHYWVMAKMSLKAGVNKNNYYYYGKILRPLIVAKLAFKDVSRGISKI